MCAVTLHGDDIESGSQLLVITIPCKLFDSIYISPLGPPHCFFLLLKNFHSSHLLILGFVLGRIPEIFSFCCMWLFFCSACMPPHLQVRQPDSHCASCFPLSFPSSSSLSFLSFFLLFSHFVMLIFFDSWSINKW